MIRVWKQKKKKTKMIKLECLKISKELGHIDISKKMDEDKYLSALFSRADKIFNWIAKDLSE